MAGGIPSVQDIQNNKVDLDNFGAVVNGDETVTMRSGLQVLSLQQVIQGLQTVISKGNWTTLTSYVLRDLVFENNLWYLCVLDHESTVFATNLAEGKWVIYPINPIDPSFLGSLSLGPVSSFIKQGVDTSDTQKPFSLTDQSDFSLDSDFIRAKSKLPFIDLGPVKQVLFPASSACYRADIIFRSVVGTVLVFRVFVGQDSTGDFGITTASASSSRSLYGSVVGLPPDKLTISNMDDGATYSLIIDQNSGEVTIESDITIIGETKISYWSIRG